jgi:hypothetical protein
MDLYQDYQAGGVEAIRKCRTESPVKYVMIIASLIPKQVKVEDERTDAFVQLWRMVGDRAKTEREARIVNYEPLATGEMAREIVDEGDD